MHVNGNGIFSNRLAIGTGISSTYKLNVYGSILARNPWSSLSGDVYTNNSWFETYLGKWKDENNEWTAQYGIVVNDIWATNGAWLRVVRDNSNKTAATFVWRVGINSASPGTELDVNGTVTALAYLYSSDKRLKTDITSITNPLQKILSLNGYLFTWKKTGTKDMWVIAQEVEKVFPEIVSTNNKGYKSVEYGNLVAPLIEAIRELNNKIDAQAKEINTLKNMIK